MNQCLRCKKPCSGSSLFCDDCAQQQSPAYHEHNPAKYGDITRIPTLPQVALAPDQQIRSENGESYETVPHPVIQEPITPLAGENADAPAHSVEQALHQLNDAARRIAAAEQGSERKGGPRRSRLSPLRDISAEIQRLSTPMPRASKRQHRKGDSLLSVSLPDLWPWLQDSDSDEVEPEWSWSNRTDPLVARQIPHSREALRIEREDLRRALADGTLHRRNPQRQKHVNRLRVAFACLAVLAVFALTIDTILASVVFNAKRPTTGPSGTPSLTLSKNKVKYGQNITLQIRKFSPSARINITRDVAEPIADGIKGGSLIQVNKDGNADIPMLIGTSWGQGFHTIEAEDVGSRYTARATLLIGAGVTRPPHFSIATKEIDFGAGLQGSSTIQELLLRNDGDGSITWSASSNRPWLLISPNQGTFSDTQKITVGGERASMKPGRYTGEITFSSNVGAEVRIPVEMTVRELPKNAGPVLVVSPPLISFIAVDGGASPAPQVLTISNPGSKPLHWQLEDESIPTTSSRDLASGSWFAISANSGTVEPGQTGHVTVQVNSSRLLSGTYSATLLFNGDDETLNNGQNVAINLTVQPRCSLALSTGMMMFTAVTGLGNPSNQGLNITASASCNASIDWKAASSSNWLTVTPASGKLTTLGNATITVGVNTNGVTPGRHTGSIEISSAGVTQSVLVELILQAPPKPDSPILSVSPLVVSFTAIKGQDNPTGQAVTIKNTGGQGMGWRTSWTALNSAWLGTSPTGGQLGKGENTQFTINVNASKLSPGTYTGKVTINATDVDGNEVSGSPQDVMVYLEVKPPCTLAPPSSSALAFSALQTNPAPQAITISATGSCNWPLKWDVNISDTAYWLGANPGTGKLIATGQSAVFSVAPSIDGLAPGTYHTNVEITATDAAGQVVTGSPQTFAVDLVVQAPCELNVSNNTIKVNTTAGANVAPQTVTVRATGSCTGAVNWSASTDAGSSGWLTLSPPSGNAAGNGDVLTITIANNLAGGVTYNGTITVVAPGVVGSPKTIAVSVVVAAPPTP